MLYFPKPTLPARFPPMPIAGLVDTATGLAARPFDTEALGEGVAFTIPAVNTQYSCVITGDAELTFTSPSTGSISTTVTVTSRCVSTGTLAATYRAADVDAGIAAEAAGYSQSLTADTALRTAVFLVGGVDINATFTAALSDASATDDPITFTITGTDWNLVTVPYRAGSAAQTLDWSFVQTNTTGTLFAMAVDVTDPGATGAPTLTITSAARSTQLPLVGNWAHYGREDTDTFDQLPGQTTIGELTTLGTLGQLLDGGAEIAFEDAPPATSYALTIAGEAGYSGVPGAGYLRLDAVVLADGTRSINESQWIGTDEVYRADTLRRTDADAIYSAQGHGHSDISTAVDAVETGLQTHEAINVHESRYRFTVPLTYSGMGIEDGHIIRYICPISGFVDELRMFAHGAPTGSAASVDVQYGAWGGTPVDVATVEIAATANTGVQTTITAPDVEKYGMLVFTLSADSGATCTDAQLHVSINPGDVVPTDPIVEGRLVPVTWAYPQEEQELIDRFEILRDASKVWETTDVTARSAQLFFYWDSVYSLRACLATTCSAVAPQLVAVFAPALAFGKTVTASSEVDPYVAANATDGRASTYWRSSVSQTQSLQIDLGQSYSITAYRLKLGTTSRAKDWVFATSADGTSWTDVDTVVDNPDQVVIVAGLSATGRYVRWSFTESASTTYLISEIEVTGS